MISRDNFLFSSLVFAISRTNSSLCNSSLVFSVETYPLFLLGPVVFFHSTVFGAAEVVVGAGEGVLDEGAGEGILTAGAGDDVLELEGVHDLETGYERQSVGLATLDKVELAMLSVVSS